MVRMKAGRLLLGRVTARMEFGKLLLGRVMAWMEVGRLLRSSKGTSIFIDHFLIVTFLACHLVGPYHPNIHPLI